MIKQLAGSIREFKKPSLLTPLFMLFEVGLECVIPLVMASLINTMYDGKIKFTFIYGAILLGLAFISLVSGILSGHFAAIASTGLARNLRKDMYYRVQDFSFANIDRFSTPGLITRLTVDVNNVQNAYMMLIRMAVRSPLMLIFSVAMTIGISPRLALIFAVIVPVVGLALFLIIKKVFPIYTKAFKQYDAFNNSIQENVKGMRVVKSYVREEYEKEKFGKESEGLRKIFTRAERILMISSPMMQFAMYAALLLLAGLGAALIIGTFGGYDAAGNPVWGQLSPGQLSSLIVYATQILFSLMMLAMVITMITMSVESGRRISEVLEEKSTIVSPENAVKEVRDGSVSICNVSFKYAQAAEKNALSDISLEIASGATVGIIGGTGSGKTTLVQLIPRLYDVDDGCVKVGGVDVRDYDVEQLRKSVAFVLQKNTLFSGTVKENIRWGDENATDEQIAEACRTAQADEFVSGMPDGYDTFIEQGGSNVSGGQKQRLCIARAILKKPKVLILDDSTSAVDTRTDAKLREAFRTQLKDTTKIIIAQRTASVQDADMIVVLDDGRVSATGTHEQLLKTSEIYKEVYYSQNKKEGKDE